MLRKLLLPSSVLAVNFFTLATQATPIDVAQGVNPVRRDNHADLKCSNAPMVVAGAAPDSESYADHEHAVLQTTLPPSGSDSPWMKYLWCTLGTRTYTFFDYGHIDTMPQGYFSVYEAFSQAATDVHNHILANGDGPIDHKGWYSAPPNTNVELWVQGKHGTMTWVQSKHGTMTWGVLGAALEGLSNAATNYNSANAPMTFQINDGQNGEMGIGYAGLSFPKPDGNGRECVYAQENNVGKLCSDWGKNVGKSI